MCQGLELGASILLCGLLSQAGREVGIGTIVWESRSRSGPQSRRGTTLSPVTITGLCAVCARAGPGRGGELLPLAEGWGPPAAWQRVGFSGMELQVDGTRGSSTVPCVTLVTEPCSSGSKRQLQSQVFQEAPSPEKACPVLPMPQIEMRFAFINISRSCGENRFELGRKFFIFA